MGFVGTTGRAAGCTGWGPPPGHIVVDQATVDLRGTSRDNATLHRTTWLTAHLFCPSRGLFKSHPPARVGVGVSEHKKPGLPVIRTVIAAAAVRMGFVGTTGRAEGCAGALRARALCACAMLLPPPTGAPKPA